MIYLISNPVGIDHEINKIQMALHTYLLREWDLNDEDYDSHPRCYRNFKGDDYIPEVYEGNGKYKEVFLDNTLKVLSFFGASETTSIDKSRMSTEAHVIFFVNLEKIYPDLTTRGDAEARKDVHLLLHNSGATVIQQVTGLANVFSEYSGWRNHKDLKVADMHPWHTFRFNLQLTYSRSTNCNYTLTD